jgi:hypothetical protein
MLGDGRWQWREIAVANGSSNSLKVRRSTFNQAAWIDA